MKARVGQYFFGYFLCVKESTSPARARTGKHIPCEAGNRNYRLINNSRVSPALQNWIAAFAGMTVQFKSSSRNPSSTATPTPIFHDDESHRGATPIPLLRLNSINLKKGSSPCPPTPSLML
jgi:hypothetical protein